MPASFKAFYHATVPDAVRYPIGYARRACVDTLRRLAAPGPLPPRRLLERVQMTPWIPEYLRIGELSYRSLSEALVRHGLALPHGQAPRRRTDVLDFGCGLGRTLRHVPPGSWRLAGCDVDAGLVDWSRKAFPSMDIRVNALDPPLPWEAETFDACWAVSVFTHFDENDQGRWGRELARVLRPGGLAAITTMGPHAIGAFPNLSDEASLRELFDRGFLYRPGAGTFNSNGAFHTAEGLERLFQDRFELLEHRSGGLDGFQDLAVLKRLEPSGTRTHENR